MLISKFDVFFKKSLFLICNFVFLSEVDIFFISDALWQLIGFLAVRHNISQYSAREKQKRRFCVTYLCFPLASVFLSYLPSIVVSSVMHCFFFLCFIFYIFPFFIILYISIFQYFVFHISYLSIFSIFCQKDTKAPVLRRRSILPACFVVFTPDSILSILSKQKSLCYKSTL